MTTNEKRESPNNRAPDQPSNVVNLGAFRAKKSITGDRKYGLEDTFNKGSLSPQSEDVEQDLSHRIERLKSSINRINTLMDELRSAPQDDLK